MFDKQTVELIDQLPRIGDFTGEIARSQLAQAYLDLINIRVSGRESDKDLPKTMRQLRQMGNGMELFCLIEFAREGALLESGRSAALIAAQSLELHAELLPHETENGRHVLAHPGVMSRIEAGLLYLIAGYYANAALMTTGLPWGERIQAPIDYNQARQNIASNVLELLVGFLNLDLDVVQRVPPGWPMEAQQHFSRAPSDLSTSIEARLLMRIDGALRKYMAYLAGNGEPSPQSAIEGVARVTTRVSRALSSETRLQISAEALLPFHLACLLEIVFKDLRSFALVHNVAPPPDCDDEYRSHVQKWIRDKARKKYTLLWPSTRKWLQERRDTDAIHTVVSMPTGSGKSFLGELALIERLHQGWGLYLAPMNALVRQIQRDLEKGLEAIGVEKVHRFLTDEHTTLEDEIFTGASAREVVVMTPEKALLAIRLTPEAFQKCSVVIFDECHLISKEGRGAVSDDLVARLLAQAPNAHLVLMSAMVQNPETLASWLGNVTGRTSVPIRFHWKPTRSLRTLAVVPEESLGSTQWARDIKPCRIQLLGHAEIAWHNRQDSLYVNTLLPTTVDVKGDYQQPQWANSVNDASRQIGVSLAGNRVPTLLFLNTQATHVWKHGRESPDLNWVVLDRTETDISERKVDAWLRLAELELGSRSPLREFHPKGVTVHSGALIDEERRASEIAYTKGLVGLMIATGTLSQGLNFPSQAVVMAGIEGDEYVGERKAEDILNALGRSGRAGFYNVGLSILVPKQIIRSLDRNEIATKAPAYLDLLQKSDACHDATSSLKQQVDNLIWASQRLDETGKLRPEDLATATLIIGHEDKKKPAAFFQRSYAAHLADSPSYVTDGMQAAKNLVDFYVRKTQCPDWMPDLAQRAGLSVALLAEMNAAINESISLESLVTPHHGFDRSIHLLRQIMQNISPWVLRDKFGARSGEDGIDELEGLPTRLRGHDLSWRMDGFDNPEIWGQQWNEVFRLLERWLRGDTYAQIAADFGLELDNQSGVLLHLFSSADVPVFPTLPRSSRSPLHTAIKSINKLGYPLRHKASGLVLLITKLMQDAQLIEEESDLPLSLGMLSQAIHWGVNTLDKAFWYYSLLPIRRVAHCLAETFPLTYTSDMRLKDEVRAAAVRIRRTPSIISSASVESQEAKQTLMAAAVLLEVGQRQ